MMKFFKSLLGSQSNSLSSKRFCGLLGWIVLMCCLGYASVAGTELPSCTTEFIFGTVTLLGVDSVTSIWKSSSSNKQPGKPSSPRGGGGKGKPKRKEVIEDEEPMDFPMEEPGFSGNNAEI